MSTLIKILQLIYGIPGQASALETVNTKDFLNTAIEVINGLEQTNSEEREERCRMAA